MKEVHTKIVLDFNFNDEGVRIESNCNLKGLNHLQKSFITLIYNRICDVIKDADFKNETRCRDLDSDRSKHDRLDNILDDLFNELKKKH